ncbi:MAG: hypothetical protein HY360_13075 [Verrucomicrobia bacterium]|nr:hypothetical protein [Verrucomicrobiota bacterium]
MARDQKIGTIQELVESHGAPALAILLTAGLLACSLSRPAAPPTSKNPPAYVLKFVPYAHKGALNGYFSLADAATNQIAASGRLRLHVHTTTSLSIGASQGTPSGGMKIKTTLYDNTFAIGVTNFHWEKFGSILSVKDLVCRFTIPYPHFKVRPRQGQVAAIEMEFHPDLCANVLAVSRNVSLY